MDKEKVRKLMDEYCKGNYNRFARELKVDPAHIYKYLTEGKGGGAKIIIAVMRFCRRKGISFYDILEEEVDG